MRRKCFVSYHQDDLKAVDAFIDRFGPKNFIKRGITLPEEVIDSTVTIVLVGLCTWSRRFVDWEIQASLRQPASELPNGLIGILLDRTTRPPLPPRFKVNRDSGYARYHYYPDSTSSLEEWIEDAYFARQERSRLIKNPRERFLSNYPRTR